MDTDAGLSILIPTSPAFGRTSMAPADIGRPLALLKRPGSSRSFTPPIKLGSSVGIGVGIALIASLVVAAGLYWSCYRPSTRTHPRLRTRNWDAMKNDMVGRDACAPRHRFGRVLAVLSPKKRKSRADLNATPDSLLPDAGLQPLQLPYQELDELPYREPAAELEGGLFGDGKVRYGADDDYLDTFEQASREVDDQGPVPPYTASASRPERDIRFSSFAAKSERDPSPMPHYRPEESSTTPPPPRNLAEISKLALDMPPVSTAPQAAWHRKRTGPPPPLTIAPPAHSRSPSDAYSAYSSYVPPSSPYEYYSFNIPLPSIPSPLRKSSPKDDSASNLSYGAPHSVHSATSTRSVHPLDHPASPQSPSSAPSMSRSNSGAQTESMSLPPPTPTYSPTGSSHSTSHSQRVPIDTTNFVCVGELPHDMPMPTPDQFRTTSRTVPRVMVPEVRRGRSLTTSSADAISPITQDHLLFANNPFRPHQNPVNPTFTREHSVHALRSLQELDSETPRCRRPSADSLGSNFTVEEEARIQAQIVKNLSMIGRERVVGGNDIVHIPQVSERRYSWEG